MNLQITEDRLEEILARSAAEVIQIRPFPCQCHVEGAFCLRHGTFQPVTSTVAPPKFHTTGGGRRVVYKRPSE